MHIAWGVMGYGRGHAMRTLGVLPEIRKHHEVTVFAGGDAYEVLSPLVPTVRIPTLGYRYNQRGQHSLIETVRHNLAPMADVFLNGPGRQRVAQEFRQRGINLVISDSEGWTHRTAMMLGLPRISFDHIGIIGYCKPHFPPDLWLAGVRDGLAYRSLMGVPERILISSFYPAEPVFPGIELVGPMLRDVVLAARPSQGEHLLAYFNKGQHQFLPAVRKALKELDVPVRVYGTGRSGQEDNLIFRPPSNTAFIDDLASARGVLATAGNQLIGECMHLGKPMLALPEEAFEQRLNAYLIERMGIGARAPLTGFTPSHVDSFLADADHYARRMHDYASDGRGAAVDTLLRMIDELGQPRLHALNGWRTA